MCARLVRLRTQHVRLKDLRVRERILWVKIIGQQDLAGCSLFANEMEGYGAILIEINTRGYHICCCFFIILQKKAVTRV